MIRILKCLNQAKDGSYHIQRFLFLRCRAYATDQPPSNENDSQNPVNEPPEDIQQRLYSGDPHHLRMDQTPHVDDSEGSIFSTDVEEVTKHETEDEMEGILEGLYTNEPMHLRVDQIQRGADEIEMMSSQLDHEKTQQASDGILPNIDSPLKQRKKRSERYFPKLVRTYEFNIRKKTLS